MLEHTICYLLNNSHHDISHFFWYRNGNVAASFCSEAPGKHGNNIVLECRLKYVVCSEEVRLLGHLATKLWPKVVKGECPTFNGRICNFRQEIDWIWAKV